jgi:LysM repeat protein
MFRRVPVRTVAVAAAITAVIAAGSASYSASYPLPGGVAVQPGDTLWAIAIANGVTVDQLAAANGMSPSDVLLVGRHLVIPTAASSSAGASTGGSTSGASSQGTTAASSANFCATTTFWQGPWGQIPSQLAANPSELSLRPVMEHWAYTYGVAPALVEAIAWQESGWQEDVVSSAGAVGVGQLLPATASFVQNDLIGTNLDINSTNDNIRMEAAFLAYLVREVGNSPCRVAAAYYQGPAALVAYGVYPETEQYVRDVLALEPEFSY